MILFTCIAVILAVVAVPSDALAWGPGVHLALGNRVLEHLGLMSPAVAELLTIHGRSFLYGCLSADIFIGKGSSFRPGHSHNWQTGLDLLESAERREIQAYAYGYLTHLAADIVAHNWYVPNLLALVPVSGRVGHVYLEMQADRRVEWSAKQAREVFQIRFNAADRNLLSTVAEPPLPFKVKKRLYKGGLIMAGQRSLQDSLRFAARRLPRSDHGAFLSDMLELSWRSVADMLQHPEAFAARAFDPIGADRLAAAPRFRRRQSILVRHKGFIPLFSPDPALACLPGVGADEAWIRTRQASETQETA
jgi:hypothetical protein